LEIAELNYIQSWILFPEPLWSLGLFGHQVMGWESTIFQT
jgi:hypothetical protein